MSYLDLANEFGGTSSSVGTGGARTYTAPGVQTYTVPSGVTSMVILVVGGGGGGGLGVAASGYCLAKGGGGGGGGQVVYNTSYPVTPGETLTLTVGAGGAANGGNGGTSSIVGLSGTIAAGGGYGSAGHSGGAAGIGSVGGGGSTTAATPGGGGGGGGQCTSGSTTADNNGGNGGTGAIHYYPGQGVYAGFGGGGGGGSGGGTNGLSDGFAGTGGTNGSYPNSGIQGLGGGGGGGGAVAPYLNGAAGGNGGVYFYAAPTHGSINIENYYRGQGYVPDIPRNSSVPYWNGTGAHPPITVTTDFYNATNLFYFTYTVANGYFAQDLCVFAAATAQGYQNDKPLMATININGVLGASTVYTYALKTGSIYSTPPTIIVNVGATGVISGHGGGPIAGDGSGGNGGNAVLLEVPTTINNNGIIQAGAAASDTVQGVYAGGAGYGYGIGVQGNQGTVNQIGTLFSGGAPQGQQTGKKSTGYTSYGGGWVSEAGQSPSTNGYPGAGSYVPGVAFVSGTTNLTLAVHGTIRGTCGI